MPTTWQLAALAPTIELETRAVLKKLPAAHRALAELKGLVATIPNESILLDTLRLQEAKDSSAIENIITTHDELFNAELPGFAASSAASAIGEQLHAVLVRRRCTAPTTRASLTARGCSRFLPLPS